MIIFIHKICMAFNGLGISKTVDSAIKDKAAMLLEKNNGKFKNLKKLI